MVKNKNKYRLYCDMDGVIVDFEKGYKKLTGVDLGTEFRSDNDFWDPINDAGHDFWVNLEWLEDGKVLWDYIKHHNPEILSAPSRQSSSRTAKHIWVERELPGVILNLRYAKHKKDFASPNHILIDDRHENINSWVSAGGIGILHTTSKSTIKKLKKLGL